MTFNSFAKNRKRDLRNHLKALHTKWVGAERKRLWWLGSPGENKSKKEGERVCRQRLGTHQKGSILPGKPLAKGKRPRVGVFSGPTAQEEQV